MLYFHRGFCLFQGNKPASIKLAIYTIRCNHIASIRTEINTNANILNLPCTISIMTSSHVECTEQINSIP